MIKIDTFKNFFTDRIIKTSVLIFITFIFNFGIYGVINSNLNNNIIFENSSNEQIGPITDKVKIKQEINVEESEINNISIQVATYERINKGKLLLNVYKSGIENPIATAMMDVAKFENNKFVIFKFKTIKIEQGEKYYFTLESTATSENIAPGVWINSMLKDNSDLYINYERAKGNLCYKIGYEKSYFMLKVLIFIISIIFSIMIPYFSNESITKRNKSIAILFFICSLIFIYFNINVFFNEKQQMNFYNFSIVFSLVFYTSYSLLYNNNFSEKISEIYKYIVLFISPFISLVVIELFNDNIIYKMNFKIIFINYICVLVVYLFLYLITNRINITIIMGNATCYLIGLVYYYVLLFRGSPVLPTDFYAIGTAVSVAKNYEFKINFIILSTSFLVILICIMCKNLEMNKLNKHKIRILKIHKISFKIKNHFRFILIISITFFIISVNTLFNISGITINLWKQSDGYKTNGVFLNFLMNMKYLKIDKPENYSLKKINEIISDTDLTNSNEIIENNISNKNPNIIAIMNESFSDLSVIDKVKTNQDYMPFIRNLKKNTIKGNMLVSTFGGGTSNSEWEFLTGNSMAFIPAGGTPYQQYIHTSSNSIASTLKTLDYDTIAIHPFGGSGWNRNKVYPLLGFDDFLTIEDFKEPEVLRNSYISDKENYRKIIEKYEEKRQSDKLFIFNVTIQNHGGYLTDNSIFEDSVYLTDYNYSDVNEYLSLIKESDEAFEELINYFSNQDEPTVILMFGDHLPSLNTEFYEKLYNKSLSSLTLEEMQKEFTVPFVIWTNYDIKEQNINKISANYLSTLLLKVANQPLPAYNKFLENLNKEIPVINKNGYMDSEGKYYQLKEEDYPESIKDYSILQYNNVFDYKNTVNSIFNLNK